MNYNYTIDTSILEILPRSVVELKLLAYAVNSSGTSVKLVPANGFYFIIIDKSAEGFIVSLESQYKSDVFEVVDEDSLYRVLVKNIKDLPEEIGMYFIGNIPVFCEDLAVATITKIFRDKVYNEWYDYIVVPYIVDTVLYSYVKHLSEKQELEKLPNIKHLTMKQGRFNIELDSRPAEYIDFIRSHVWITK